MVWGIVTKDVGIGAKDLGIGVMGLGIGGEGLGKGVKYTSRSATTLLKEGWGNNECHFRCADIRQKGGWNADDTDEADFFEGG